MFRKNFVLLTNFIVNPVRAWKTVSQQQVSHSQFLTGYFYPLIGVVSVVIFAAAFYYGSTPEKIDYAIALKTATLFLFTSFAGFYTASFLLNELMPRFFKVERNRERIQQFIGYTSTIYILGTMLLNMRPTMFFLRFIPLYMLVVIWEASGSFIPIPTARRPLFLFVSFMLILVSLFVIEIIIRKMMPGL